MPCCLVQATSMLTPCRRRRCLCRQTRLKRGRLLYRTMRMRKRRRCLTSHLRCRMDRRRKHRQGRWEGMTCLRCLLRRASTDCAGRRHALCRA